MKKQPIDKGYQKILDRIIRASTIEVNDEGELDSAPFVINEQKQRDSQATEILKAYVKDYQDRSDKNKTYRGVLFWGGTSLTFLIILVCITLLALWVPVIIGQYGEPAAETKTAETEALDFDQLTEKVETLLTAPAETADAAALAEAIAQMVEVSVGTEETNATSADLSVKNVVSLITVCLTLLAAIIGILKIIAQYVFQTNEQANVNEIVKSLQAIDYSHKRAEMELKSGKKLSETPALKVPGEAEEKPKVAT
jgi:hypothetical protein